jgi:hypothetical protein
MDGPRRPAPARATGRVGRMSAALRSRARSFARAFDMPEEWLRTTARPDRLRHDPDRGRGHRSAERSEHDGVAAHAERCVLPADDSTHAFDRDRFAHAARPCPSTVRPESHRGRVASAARSLFSDFLTWHYLAVCSSQKSAVPDFLTWHTAGVKNKSIAGISLTIL